MNKILKKFWVILLKGQQPEKSDELIYIFGTFGLLIVFIIFLIISNVSNNSKIKLKEFKSKLVNMEELKSKEDEIKLRFADLTLDIPKLKDKFVIEDEVEPLKTSLAKFAQKYGGNNISTMPQAQTREGFVTKIPIKMGMEISFDSLIRFLHLLEHSNKFIDVTHIALNTIGEGGKKLRVDFTLSLYLLTPDIENLIDNILPEVKVKKQIISLALAENVPVPLISKNPFISPEKRVVEAQYVWPNFKLEAVVTGGATISVEGRKYYNKTAGDYIDANKWPDIKILRVESMKVILINKKGEKKVFTIGETLKDRGEVNKIPEELMRGF